MKNHEPTYSLLDVAPVAKGSTAAKTFKNSLDLAQKTEAMGYTRFWLAEHHNMLHIASAATSVLIGHIGGGTKKIRVGSGGVMLPNYSPLIVAEQFGTLGLLYPGRIDLGLGRAPGTDPDTALAIRADRMASVHNFPEEISRIQQYLSTENSNSKVRVPFAEGVDLPIYILGSSTDSAYVAAQKGLPYAFASHFAPAQLLAALNIYYNEFQPSSFLQEPYSIACINVIAADTDEKAEKLSTSLLRMFVNILTGNADYLQEPTGMTTELRELWLHPSVQQMLKYTFVGSKETVKRKTEEFLRETGVNELMVVTNTYDHADRVQSYRIFAEIMQEQKTEKVSTDNISQIG
ncbi:LLM class flavin-dependent oxidoreductase [Terrimonas pollutisoli]|uniref:LLM class flavin-dependent oxidoreductase n=1 Tax=Terrimonas pollutisoli TaxID=3034147 RepID=UPI0023EAD328|nr:LLM class flavin-dependent oxidoreductase [Terrimonas sp. H1YJ31]